MRVTSWVTCWRNHLLTACYRMQVWYGARQNLRICTTCRNGWGQGFTQHPASPVQLVRSVLSVLCDFTCAQFCFWWFINLFLTFCESSPVQSTSVHWLVTLMLDYFLWNSSSHTHPKTAHECVETSLRLALAWCKSGLEKTPAKWNWKEPSWWWQTLQDWNARLLARQHHSPYLGSCGWSFGSDGCTHCCW